jgi:hypothetical protein
VEHTQIHLALKRVQKNSITLAKLVEFLVISIFHETKIQKVDVKVQVYSKFSKNKIPKKIKTPNSMRNGRFHISKCRGKLEKIKKFENSDTAVGQARARWAIAGHWPTLAASPLARDQRSPAGRAWVPFNSSYFPHFSSYLPFFSSFFPYFWALWSTPP